MASTANAGSDSTQTEENSRSDTSLQEFAEQDWTVSTILTGRKEKRWLSDASELYIEETGDWQDTDKDFQVRYREGRLGPSEQLQYGEFNDLDNAVKYAELIVEGRGSLGELKEDR